MTESEMGAHAKQLDAAEDLDELKLSLARLIIDWCTVAGWLERLAATKNAWSTEAGTLRRCISELSALIKESP